MIVEQPAGPLEARRAALRLGLPGQQVRRPVHLRRAAAGHRRRRPTTPRSRRARLERILTWKAERLAAAKLFKTAAAKSLPIAPQYRVQRSTSKRPETARQGQVRSATGCAACARCSSATPKDAAARPDARGARWVGRSAAGQGRLASLAPVQAVARDRRKLRRRSTACARPASTAASTTAAGRRCRCPGPGQLAFLQTSGLGVLDVTDSPALADALAAQAEGVPPARRASRPGPGPCGASPARTAPPRLEALLPGRAAALVESREGYVPALDTQLLVYDGRRASWSCW